MDGATANGRPLFQFSRLGGSKFRAEAALKDLVGGAATVEPKEVHLARSTSIREETRR